MKSHFQLHWNEEDLSRALHIPIADLSHYLTDGRRASFLVERRLKWEHVGWSFAPSEKANYDLLDPEGGKWEVRSVTHNGAYFTPSNQVGYGRKFNEAAFMKKLDDINGYILADIVGFPVIDIVTTSAEVVRNWYFAGMLGVNAHISHKRFWRDLFPNVRRAPLAA